MKICSTEGCDRVQRARGYCINCYSRKCRNGEMKTIIKKRRHGMTLQETVDHYIHQSNLGGHNGDCIELRKSLVMGYPNGKYNNKQYKVGRLVLMLHYGEKPDLWMLHSCDNPLCINIKHLSYGTPQENSRQRSIRCPRNSRIKLWPEDVIEICNLVANGEQINTIAERFGVAPNTISNINSGVNWSHVTGISYRGPQQPKPRLRANDIIEIRKAIDNGEIQNKIAERFGVSSATISNIKSGKSWSHVTT